MRSDDGAVQVGQNVGEQVTIKYFSDIFKSIDLPLNGVNFAELHDRVTFNDGADLMKPFTRLQVAQANGPYQSSQA